MNEGSGFTNHRGKNLYHNEFGANYEKIGFNVLGFQTRSQSFIPFCIEVLAVAELIFIAFGLGIHQIYTLELFVLYNYLYTLYFIVAKFLIWAQFSCSLF